MFWFLTSFIISHQSINIQDIVSLMLVLRLFIVMPSLFNRFHFYFHQPPFYINLKLFVIIKVFVLTELYLYPYHWWNQNTNVSPFVIISIVTNNHLFIVVILMLDRQFLNLLISNHYLLLVIFFEVPFQFTYIDLLLVKLDII